MTNLDGLFDELNRRWFDGKLRRCKVRWSSLAPKSSDQNGLYDSKRRTIYIARGLSLDDLTSTLLHEMCHVGCPSHGKRFMAKMVRLKSMGAPILEYELEPPVNPFREAGRIIADAVVQLPEGMTWSKGRHHVADALSLSVRDLERQIPWARQRWERLQREEAKARRIQAQLLARASGKISSTSTSARRP